MLKISLLFFLAVMCMAPVSAAPTVLLPDTNVYFYWFRTDAGTTSAPKSTGHNGSIVLAGHPPTSGTLCVQDPRTGNIASVPMGTALAGAALTVADFHGKAATTGQPPAAQAPPPATPPDGNGVLSVVSHIVTWIIGLAVFAGAAWFVRLLFLTKGQLLIDLARKTGVDVPNPDDLPPSEVLKEGKYEPPPVPKVQRVPEDAVRPINSSGSTGFLIADNGTAYSIGSKTTSIGRGEENDIVLIDDSVSRKHATIRYAKGTVELSDENSANGIFVNGQKVSTQVLSAGDRVLIGRFGLKYEK